MSSQPISKTERRRLVALWLGVGLYFLLLLNSLQYVGRLPFQILALALILNGAIFTTILLAIRQTYKRMQVQRETGVVDVPAARTAAEQHKIRRLWFAAGLYFILMLVGIQYAAKAPYQLLVGGGILNMAIILTFVVKLRHAYLGKTDHA